MYNKPFFRLLITLAILLLLSLLPAPAQGQEGDSEQQSEGIYNDAYYRLESLNQGLPAAAEPPNLQTPQAALEHFVRAVRQENYDAAAHALNLNLIPEAEQAARGPALARKLYSLLTQKFLIDWDKLPDRPDGQEDFSSQQNDPLAGVPRRSIRLGAIDLDGRDIVVRLQRVKAGQAEPVWVFSANTVENIDPLYERFGPGPLDEMMPAWAKVRLLGRVPLWEWAAVLLLLALGIGSGLAIRRPLERLLRRPDRPRMHGLATKAAGPIALLVGLLLFYLPIHLFLSLTGPVFNLINPLFFTLVVGTLTWLGMRIVQFFSDYVGTSYAQSFEEDNEVYRRRVLTYISVARRVLIAVALFAGVGLILSQFATFNRFGIAILTSASVLGIIIGIAAQSVLGNIIAGIQIAIAQPVRIGDNVYFEDNWGYIEEIAYTYLTIRTWDQRRVMVPLKYFMSHPIQNWSRTSAHLIKPIYIYADYRIDVETVRQKFAELLRNDDEWDEKKEPTVQVTGVTEETVEIRALCSAKDPSSAWSLHCRLREELLEFVQGLADGRYLPKRRLLFEDQPDERRNRADTRQESQPADRQGGPPNRQDQIQHLSSGGDGDDGKE